MRESSSPILFRRRYLYRTAYRLTALILILILMLISTTACMSEQGQSNETLEAISTSSQINLPSPATTIKPGTGELRLWWQKPQDYSPLKPATAEQKGIYSLLYQTLFAIDDMGYICPEIAADYRWSNDRLKIKIDLEPGLEFSDGTILKPEDVKASIESWIANRGWLVNSIPSSDDVLSGQDDIIDATAEQSLSDMAENVNSTTVEVTEDSVETLQTTVELAENTEEDVSADPAKSNDSMSAETSETGLTVDDIWANADAPSPNIEDLIFLNREQAMAAIKQVVAKDSFIEIHLSERCDNLLDFLVIPIIPTVYSSGLLSAFPPGTGSWYCAEQLITGEAKLKRTRNDNELAIQVLAYDSHQQAMKAFLNKEVDLLLLSATAWPRFGGLKDLRTRKLPTGNFVYLQLNVNVPPLNSKSYFQSITKAFLRSALTVDRPAGSWLYSPIPERGSHPFLPSAQEIKQKLEELSAEADFVWLHDDPVQPLLMTWPQFEEADIVGEQIRRELRLQQVPVVRAGESLIPESTSDPSLSPTPMETLPPTPTPDPNLIYLPSITPEPTPTALDPAQVPETAALELVLSAADLYEPYLFFKTAGETGVPENESLLVLKELYSLRLAGRSSEASGIRDDYSNNSGARLAGIMALIELLQQYNMIGIAVPCNVVCYGERIEGDIGLNVDNPYFGLEELIIWP